MITFIQSPGPAIRVAWSHRHRLGVVASAIPISVSVEIAGHGFNLSLRRD